MSLRKCHTFVPNLRAIPTIVPGKGSGTCLCRFPEFPSLCLISSFPDLINQFSMFYPCVSLWHHGSHLWFLWTFLWIFPCSLISFLCPHSWTMTCSACPCQTIACLCSCVHCSLVANVLQPHLKHPSRGLNDPFPFPCERELTASTSMGSECPRDPVSLGFESRILQPNFSSTCVTISKRASSIVRKRFELRIKRFSSSSGTSASRPASLI